jgi:hypothetical protein
VREALGVRDPERVQFLAELSELHEDFVVWKNLDRSLVGRGDVDAAAPTLVVPSVIASASRIAPRTLGASHVVHCRHVADKHLAFFVQPHRLPQLFELDVCSQPSRGLAPWADPVEMAALSELSAERVRRLRPGAQAVIDLVYEGLSPGGADRLTAGDRTRMRLQLRTDRAGAVSAAALFLPAPAGRTLVALLTALERDEWDRRAAVATFAALAASSLRHPGFLMRRLALRTELALGRECIMSHLGRKLQRRVPEDIDTLLRAARLQGHEVAQLR